MNLTRFTRLSYPFGGSSSPTPPPAETSGLIRRAVAAALAGDAGVAAVVAARVAPVAAREKTASPCLLYRLLANARERTLSGPLGKSRAKFRVTARSRQQADCEALAEAVRNLFDGFSSHTDGLLGGLVAVDWCHELDEADDKEPPGDGTDKGPFETAVEFEVRYREPKPVR